jgi:hypothetical protein
MATINIRGELFTTIYDNIRVRWGLPQGCAPSRLNKPEGGSSNRVKGRKTMVAVWVYFKSDDAVKPIAKAALDGLLRRAARQGWTRYIQGQAAPVRREAESAIGDWLVRNRPLGCDLRG